MENPACQLSEAQRRFLVERPRNATDAAAARAAGIRPRSVEGWKRRGGLFCDSYELVFKDPVAFSAALLPLLAPKAVAVLGELLDSGHSDEVALGSASLLLRGTVVLPGGRSERPRDAPDRPYLEFLARLRLARGMSVSGPWADRFLNHPELGPRIREQRLAIAEGQELSDGKESVTHIAAEVDARTDPAQPESQEPIELSGRFGEILVQLCARHLLDHPFSAALGTREFHAKDVFLFSYEDGDEFALQTPAGQTRRRWRPTAIVYAAEGPHVIVLHVASRQHRCWQAHHRVCPEHQAPERPPCRFWESGLAEVVHSERPLPTDPRLPQCATDFDLMRLQLAAWRSKGKPQTIPLLVVETDEPEWRRWVRRAALWNATLNDVEARVRLVRASDLIGTVTPITAN